MSAIAGFIHCITCGCFCKPSKEEKQQKEPLKRDFPTPVNGSSERFPSYQGMWEGRTLQHLQYSNPPSRIRPPSPSPSREQDVEDSSSEDEVSHSPRPSPSRHEHKDPKSPFRSPHHSPRESRSPFHSPGSGTYDTTENLGWDSMAPHGTPPKEV